MPPTVELTDLDLPVAALQALLPDGCSLVARSTVGPAPPLDAGEEAHVAKAVAKRRREFAFGRACARRALELLGMAPSALPVGPDRAPVWPPAVVGSITHCQGLAAAAVAPRRALEGIGIDAELAEPLERDLRRLILTERERTWIAHTEAPANGDWAKLVFCAKESVHKCIAPITGIMLDFLEVDLVVEPRGGRFRAHLAPGSRWDLPDVERVDGRFAIAPPFVLTSCLIG